MNTQYLPSELSYYQMADSLNTQLQRLKSRMQAHLPELDRVSFALFDQQHKVLKTYADSAFWSLRQAHYEAPMNELPALMHCALQKENRIIDDLASLPSSKHVEMLLSYGYRSSAAIPCYEKDCFKGFIFLNSRTVNVFSEHSIELLMPYINMIKFSVVSENDIVHLIASTARQLFDEANLGLKDSQAHKERIGYYTKLIASYIADDYGFDDETVEHLSLFAQFHDIGKVRLPEQLICQHCQLDEVERAQMRDYIQHGMDIVDDILDSFGFPQHPSIMLLTEIMAYHQEYLDGSGYPKGLCGEQIPISARIVTTANVFDALTAHRPYRQAWSIPHAMLELEKMVNQGKLDRQCVNALREHQYDISVERDKYPEYDPKDF
ncbi:HD domain-containing protein [Vibrio sp. AK197]